jgi:MFS family permease
VTSVEETELESGPPPIGPSPGKPRGTGWSRVAIDVRPLRHPAYRRMFIGSTTSFFGAQFTVIAVPLQVYAMTRSDLWVGYVSAAGFVPLLVFALWGGALADVLDRRALLLGSSILSWLMTLGLLAQALFGVNSPILVLVLVALQTGAVAVTMPTRGAIIPRVVPTDEIPQANTLNYTMSQVASVLGPLVAALVITTFGDGVNGHSSRGFGWAYTVDALTFTVALWAAMRLPHLPPVPSDGPATTSRGGWSDVMFGLRYLAGTPVLLLSFAVDIVAMVLAMPLALFPDVAAHRFASYHDAAGWLYSAISIGAVVAGVTSGWIARVRRQGLALIIAVVAWGIAIAVSGLAHQLWLAVVLLAVAGMADMVSAVYRQTLLLTYAPDELRGRMQGVFTAVVAGGPRLGALRAGLTAAAFGTTIAWVGGGIACAIVAVLLGVSFPALARYRMSAPSTGEAAA